MDDDLYWGIGNLLGGLSALAVFLGSWWYCAETYGYLFGFGLGWIPSLIAAVITFFAVKVLWGLAALLIIFLIYQAYSNDRTASAKRSSVPDYVDSASQDTVKSWLELHPTFRILNDTDCQCEDKLIDIRTQSIGNWKALPNYHPYFSKGDFNGDKIIDFAFMVSENNQLDKSRVLIFSVEERGAVSFLSDEVGRGEALFYGPPRPKPYRLLVGPFFAHGSLFEPTGAGQYVMRNYSEDNVIKDRPSGGEDSAQSAIKSGEHGPWDDYDDFSTRVAGETPSSAANVIPRNFRGRWAEAASDCKVQHSVTELSVVVDFLAFYESNASVRSVALENARSLTITASSSGEGQASDSSFHLALSRSGQDLTVESGGSSFTRTRCSDRP